MTALRALLRGTKEFESFSRQATTVPTLELKSAENH
jgi:hypothetical protein